MGAKSTVKTIMVRVLSGLRTMLGFFGWCLPPPTPNDNENLVPMQAESDECMSLHPTPHPLRSPYYHYTCTSCPGRLAGAWHLDEDDAWLPPETERPRSSLGSRRPPGPPPPGNRRPPGPPPPGNRRPPGPPPPGNRRPPGAPPPGNPGSGPPSPPRSPRTRPPITPGDSAQATPRHAPKRRSSTEEEGSPTKRARPEEPAPQPEPMDVDGEDPAPQPDAIPDAEVEDMDVEEEEEEMETDEDEDEEDEPMPMVRRVVPLPPLPFPWGSSPAIGIWSRFSRRQLDRLAREDFNEVAHRIIDGLGNGMDRIEFVHSIDVLRDHLGAALGEEIEGLTDHHRRVSQFLGLLRVLAATAARIDTPAINVDATVRLMQRIRTYFQERRY